MIETSRLKNVNFFPNSFLVFLKKLKDSKNQEKTKLSLGSVSYFFLCLLQQTPINGGRCSRLMLIEKHKPLEIHGNTDEGTKTRGSGA